MQNIDIDNIINSVNNSFKGLILINDETSKLDQIVSYATTSFTLLFLIMMKSPWLVVPWFFLNPILITVIRGYSNEAHEESQKNK